MGLKRDLKCPNCAGRAIWRIDQTKEQDGFLRPLGFRGINPRGRFETMICKACGYTEWYADGIDQLRPDPIRGVELLDGDLPGRGPYR